MKSIIMEEEEFGRLKEKEASKRWDEMRMKSIIDQNVYIHNKTFILFYNLINNYF